MFKYILIVVISFNMFGCESDEFGNCERTYWWGNITNYDYPITERTPILGIAISNQTMYSRDWKLIDERIIRFESDMRNIAYTLPSELPKEWGCKNNQIDPEKVFDWSCLVIKVIDPVISKCSVMGDPSKIDEYSWLPEKGWPLELSGVSAPAEGCTDKGLVPTEECPCQWRTLMQDGHVIITPPTIYLWNLMTFWTGCQGNMWATPFKEAANADVIRAEQVPLLVKTYSESVCR